MLKRMFEMQRSLNVTIGRDTVGALQSLKDEWLHQYIFALEDEVYEFSISEDKDNVKIELIDMILFAISICQILDVTSEEIEKDVLFTIGTFRELYHSLHSDSWDIDQLHISIGSLKHQIEFKWWSKLIKENPNKQFKIIKDREIAKQCSINILIDIFKLAFVYGMAPHQIFSIYQKKHQVNLDRQKNGYDDRNKTEADNQKIISEMSEIEFVKEIDKDLSIIDDMGDHKFETTASPLGKGLLEINPIQEANSILKVAIKGDESYAWAWHCNIAIPIHDEGVDIEVANKAAARIMSHVFDYDSTPLIPKYRRSMKTMTE